MPSAWASFSPSVRVQPATTVSASVLAGPCRRQGAAGRAGCVCRMIPMLLTSPLQRLRNALPTIDLMNELSSAGPRTEPADVRLRSLRAEAEGRVRWRGQLSRSARAGTAVTDDSMTPKDRHSTVVTGAGRLVAAESSRNQLDAALAGSPRT